MVRRTALLLWVTAAMLAVLAPGCASRTEVIIAVETDIATIDRVTITVASPTGAMQTSSGTFGTGGAGIARTLGVTWSSGPLGPFVATATGFRTGAPVIARTAVFEFVQGETRILHIDLLAACQGVVCGSGQTCGDSGTCRPQLVSAGELDPYSGSITSHDAASSPADGGGTDASSAADTGHDAALVMMSDSGHDAAMCPAETCNRVDDDCDGMTDEDFMLQTDPANCGSCGIVCNLDHSTDPTCNTGRCRIGTCDAAYSNCDGRNSTGCEVSRLTDTNNCGDCGIRCTGGTPMCCNGTCAAGC